MTHERWKAISRDEGSELTKEEIAEGWHFCLEFDGLLVGPGMSELECCACWPKDHPVYTAKDPNKKEK